MIKKAIIIFLLECILCHFAAYTTPNAASDSLLILVSAHKHNDTQKVDLLNNLAYACAGEMYANDTSIYTTCRYYAEDAVNLAQKLKYAEGLARAYNISGIISMYAGRYYQAFSFYKKAEPLYIALHDSLRLGYVYENIARTLSLVFDMDNLMVYANKLFELGMKRHDPNFVGSAIIYMLRPFEIKYDDQLLDGMQYVVGADQVSTATRNVVEMMYGLQLVENKRSLDGLKHLHKVRLAYEKNTAMLYPQREVYIRLGQAHAILKHVDSALYYMDKAIRVPLKDDNEQQYVTECVYAHIDSLRGDYLGTIKHHQACIQLKKAIDEKYKTHDINRIKNWAELEQQEKANQLLQQEKKAQKHLIYLLSLLLVLVFVLIVWLVIYYRRRIADHKLLQQTNTELKELHSVKDKLFSLVAHDLRSPIATLGSFLKIASQTTMDQKMQQYMLKELSIKVDETFMLLNNLLQWSKTQMKGIQPKPGYFNIQEESLVITNQLAKQAAEKDIILQNNIVAQQVYGDPDMFDVILRNIVANAIKFTNQQGSVRLESKLVGDFAEISVTDSGVGIPLETQQKLFKLNETVTQRGTANEKGTGLGLILCADFVRVNGGKIWLESQEGKGSTFFFTIPIENSSV